MVSNVSKEAFFVYAMGSLILILVLAAIILLILLIMKQICCHKPPIVLVPIIDYVMEQIISEPTNFRLSNGNQSHEDGGKQCHLCLPGRRICNPRKQQFDNETVGLSGTCVSIHHDRLGCLLMLLSSWRTEKA
ncbi:unnamed protein product [Cylicocyclus nassatus]|uniref:Uncharacterized protein n=1 Tax=Cylicocyclus nassatus TaxID=53992 RepID=A0AA36M1B9_CYLNA|nr:unnamed protein product [Cylicocyclus nassatus]